MFCGKNLFQESPGLSESGKETGSDKRQAALIDNKMPVFNILLYKKPQHENAAALVRRIKTSVWAEAFL